MDAIPSLDARALTNRQAPWDDFDPAAYLEHNYRTLREDDRQILAAVRDHFAGHFEGHPAPEGLQGLDVGAGTNLYPALAMLPWCAGITLFERSAGNAAWLRGAVREYGENWDAFWEVLREQPAYRRLADPRALLRETATVVQGDLFADLPERIADLGTMFFVAESLSSAYQEYQDAIGRFARALRPGAPFAVAFMENSDGYEVGEHTFPACKIERTDVLSGLREYAADTLAVSHIDVPGSQPLRDGYTGMLLALGRLRA
ncbi:SCO2525 family SAM-dependent methyltransferase [Kitasatospora viridis]|uniref:NNMT/PNMT/TEMT family protein n=1 Tax=Kitasatospora viridis TaxID=281105 RepID=A0A561UG80_9ACTN|nr:SCO2525 family SAM-dependent methyltransferase [Kitasatospora viridis]TWF98371.1 NNMT/PNMT/TEMT family protein [Kitasatospora viridis]